MSQIPTHTALSVFSERLTQTPTNTHKEADKHRDAVSPYDLPDLAALLSVSPGLLLILGPVDQLRYPLTASTANTQYNITLAAFGAAGRANAVQMTVGSFTKAQSRAALFSWLTSRV